MNQHKRTRQRSLDCQHQLCKNPSPNRDIKALFADHTCALSNGARGPSFDGPSWRSIMGSFPLVEAHTAIQKEAGEYGIGEVKYYVVMITSAILWQVVSMGTIGIIYCSSSLFAGVVSSLLLPLTQVAAVIAFHEKFTSEKGMASALCLWGFASFFIGEYKKTYKPEATIGSSEDKHETVNDGSGMPPL